MVVIKLYAAALMGALSLMLVLLGFQCGNPIGPHLVLLDMADVCGAPG